VVQYSQAVSDLMNRREFLEEIAGISALVPGLAVLTDCPEAFAQQLHARARAAPKLQTLKPRDDAIVTRIADILLPATDTVGASAVGVNRFIDLLLSEAMLEVDRKRFLDGLGEINARCQSLYGTAFPSARTEQQEALVRVLDAQLPLRNPTLPEAAALAKEPLTAERGFGWLKGLVVLGYFTSEPVARELLKAAPIVPGRYDGCVPV
jgi:Gluconate 2-dehydrogenase subunit 3